MIDPMAAGWIAIPIVAHMGGIDEIAIFVVPAVAAIILLRMVEKRARRDRPDKEEKPDST